MNEIKHVAIYLRLSRDEENRGIEDILANHRQILLELVKQKNWSYEIYEEIASSITIEKRTKMVELLERAVNNEFDAVVVIAIDRLSRNEYDASNIKRILLNSNTFIVTPSKTYDPAKDEDSLLLGIQNLVASQEYKQILKRMQRGKLYASNQGHWTNGTPPLGYVKDPKTKKLEPNDKAEHVKYIFKSIVEGKNITALYTELNNMGVKTRTNNSFTFNAVYRIVTNEAYKGTIISNRTIGKHEGMRPKKDWIVIPHAHEAIIDEKTWEKANKIVTTYYFAAPRGKNRTYPTSKLIYCAYCNIIQGTQVAHTGKVYIKMCRYCYNKTHQYEPILKLIKEEVVKYRQIVVNAVETMETTFKSNNTVYRLKQLEGQIRKVTQALNNIEILFEESEISLQQYRERKAKRNEELEQLNLELEKVEQETPQNRIDDLKEMARKVDYLLGNWEFLDGEGLTDEEVNKALNFIIERIDWYFKKGEVEPTLKITWK